MVCLPTYHFFCFQWDCSLPGILYIKKKSVFKYKIYYFHCKIFTTVAERSIWSLINQYKELVSIVPSTFQKLSSKGVLQKRCSMNSAKLTGKQLCQSLFFSKVAGRLRPATLLKKDSSTCFPVSFLKFWRTPFFAEHLRWLL